MAAGDVFGCLGLAGIATSVMLWSRMRAPLGADEGYLWYGVQQWLKGRMPHRDFRSYEPGRYLWSGGFARVFGDGLLALRASTHLFFACALVAALVMLRRAGIDWWTVGCAAVGLTVLSHPQHKQFEHGAMLLSWTANLALWMHPSAWTLGAAAATVGLSLFLGFNLFLYFGAALLLTLVVAAAIGLVALEPQTLSALVAGALLGLFPFACMACVPGFARNFHRRRVATVLARGESNLALPLPWPWREAPRQLRSLDPAHRRAFGWVFLAMMALPLVALVAAVLEPARYAMLVPAAALALFVSHHAASRADPPHITQALGPVCLLSIQLCAQPAAAFVLVALALWLVWPLQPAVQRHRNPDAFVRRLAGGWSIDDSRAEAALLDHLGHLSAGRQGAWLFAAPAFPAVYARMGVDAPVYDIFPLYPASRQAQCDMIDGIVRAQARVALVSDGPVDGRDDLRFSQTHPQVWAYLREHFTVDVGAPPGARILVRTECQPSDGSTVEMIEAAPRRLPVRSVDE